MVKLELRSESAYYDDFSYLRKYYDTLRDKGYNIKYIRSKEDDKIDYCIIELNTIDELIKIYDLFEFDLYISKECGDYFINIYD